jgi:hypothetical protein
MNQLNLYCCGGAAINIGKYFLKYVGSSTDGYAKLHTCFIDTSKSNLSHDIPDELIYVLDKVDGSGKYRASNYEQLAKVSDDILDVFKPSRFNVVIHSASGGTGSTIGPILVNDLLARGENVVVITIGSIASRIETDNTIKTLKSYEMITHKTGKPVPVVYRQNSADGRGIVDQHIHSVLVTLAIMFSGCNREMDTADLVNWLDYRKVTSHTAKISELRFFEEQVDIPKGTTLVSVATLSSIDRPTDVGKLVEYQTVGFLNDQVCSSVSKLPIHGCILTGSFTAVMDGLSQHLNSYPSSKSNTDLLVDVNSESTDKGLIL